MVALSFNAAQVKPNIGLEPVPSGLYPVIITGSVEKPTKNGQGAYLEFEMTIMQGHEFAGRKVFDRLNIKNQSQTTVDIAYGTLSSICHVTNRLNMTDTQQLHGIPFQVIVVKVPRDDQPEVFTNNVRGYKDMNGNDPGTAGNAAQPAGQPAWAQNGGGQPPQQVQQQWQQTQQPPAQPPQQPDPNAAPPQNGQPAWAQPGAQPAAAPANPPWAQQQ